MIDWLRRDRTPPTIRVGSGDLPLAIRRHSRATRMTLRLAPDGSEVRVTLPRWGRTADAMDFATSRQDWLSRQLDRIPRQLPPRAGGTLAFRGQDLAIEWAPSHPRNPRVEENRLLVGGPEAGLPQRVRRWLEREAAAMMEADLADYCRQAQRKRPPLRLSRAQRRWGSCAADGTIRINWRLIQAPDHVRRSVVAHEVAHLVHFDHSPAFHAMLDALFEGDLAAANGWLRRHGRSLYASFG
jgi:predicted metal-dependent hydrolase